MTYIDVEGVCRELGVGGNLASSASAIASSSGATLARSSSSESLTSTTIVSPMTVDNPSQPTQQIVSSVTQAVQTQARSGAGHVAASVGAFGVAAGAAFALAGL